MSRDLLSLIRYEAKRKPHVDMLLKRAGSLTDEEIDSADVPLPWFRKALRMARQIEHERGFALYLTGQHENSAELMKHVRVTIREDHEGEIWKWNSSTMFVHTETRMETEIRTGDLVFVRDGKIWHEPCFLEGSPLSYQASCIFVSKGNKQAYLDMVKAKREAECPLDAPVLDLTGNAQSQSPSNNYGLSGVTFTHHPKS